MTEVGINLNMVIS